MAHGGRTDRTFSQSALPPASMAFAAFPAVFVPTSAPLRFPAHDSSGQTKSSAATTVAGKRATYTGFEARALLIVGLAIPAPVRDDRVSVMLSDVALTANET